MTPHVQLFSDPVAILVLVLSLLAIGIDIARDRPWAPWAKRLAIAVTIAFVCSAGLSAARPVYTDYCSLYEPGSWMWYLNFCNW